MLRFCLKCFLMGAVVAISCYLLLLALPRGPWSFLFLIVWPTGILMAADAPGISIAGVMLLVGICALGNGFFYAVIGAIFRAGTHPHKNA